MKNLLLFAIISDLFFNYGKAQEEKSMRTFHTLGFAPLLEYYASPVEKIKLDSPIFSYNYQTGLNDSTDYAYAQTTLAGLGSIQYRYRYNLKEFSPNQALAFSISPALGIHLSDDSRNNSRKQGGLSLVIPVMIEMETGVGSTYNSEKEQGAFLGLGLEYIRGPLIKSKTFAGRSGWIQPVACAGIRYWSRGNSLREINIKYGKAGKGEKIPDNYYKFSGGWKAVKSYSVRVSWVMFFNY